MAPSIRLAFAALGLTTGLAHAHVVVEPRNAAAGSSAQLTFRVGHGCDAIATTAIVVTFPADVKIVEALPKAGWTLDVRQEPVVRITWRKRPEGDHGDDFAAKVVVPGKLGQRRFAIRQECEGKSANWDPPLDVVK